MPASEDLYNQLDRYRSLEERLRRFLSLPQWTPAMGALLIFGVTPPASCIDIPVEATSLDNRPVKCASEPLNNARKVIAQWHDWCEDIGETKESMSPAEFFIWCDQEEIETDWLRLLRYLAGCPVQDFLTTMPSPMHIFASPRYPTQPSSNLSAGAADQENQIEDINDSPDGDHGQSVNHFAESLSETRHKPNVIGLPTPAMAAAFSGISGWNADRWKKNLSEIPNWARPAIVQKGKRGKGQATLWNPVELAILTLTARDIDAKAFIKAFRDVKSLAPWAEDWKEYVSKEQWFGP